MITDLRYAKRTFEHQRFHDGELVPVAAHARE